MKKIICIILLLAAKPALSQQSFSSNFINDIDTVYRHPQLAIYWDSIGKIRIEGASGKAETIRKLRQEKSKLQRDFRRHINMNLPVFGVYGIGNINQESLASLNASGKISLYARPVQWRNNAITIFASYNKGASNNDSVIYDKLIFPEIGNRSFTGTTHFDKYWKYDRHTGHMAGVFVEFAYKKIISDSVSVKGQQLYFNSLTYTAGLKYVYGFCRPSQDDSTKNTELSFFIIPYVSTLNIPNEDTTDYRSMLARGSELPVDRSQLTDNVWSAGVKIGFQINSLQIFADFRSVTNRNKIPIRGMQGFHSNIGLVFNAEVFDFRKSNKKHQRN